VSVLTSLDITPPVFTVLTGGTVSLLASARNQVGDVMRGVSVSWSVSGGGTISQTGAFTAGSTVGGMHRVVATAVSGAVTLRDTARVDVSNVAATHRMIACGNNANTPSGWENDDAVVGGGSDWTNPASVTTAGVMAAAPVTLYRSVRSGSPHSYSIAGLPRNMYTVRLHFADAYDSTTYVRAMSYTVAGVNVLRDFSIVRQAGGTNRALAMDFPADLRSTNTLSIQCEGLNGSDVFEAGIEVLEHRGTAITLLSPNGGEQFAVGQQVEVRWYADTLRVLQLLIEVSVDNGESWTIVSGSGGIAYAPGSPDWGLLRWTVTATVSIDGAPVPTASSQCRV
jgi:hypothetical protein